METVCPEDLSVSRSKRMCAPKINHFSVLTNLVRGPMMNVQLLGCSSDESWWMLLVLLDCHFDVLMDHVSQVWIIVK